MKVELALLLLAVLSPLWIMPFSTPVFPDVVVVMHHDSAVNTAVRTIVANAPQVQVVEYGSLEYALTIHRTLGRVVWVSHGSEEGIVAGQHILSWNEFSDRVVLSPGLDIILACDSEKLIDYVDQSSQVLVFPGYVESTLGALIVASILTGYSLNITLTMLVDALTLFTAGILRPQFLDLTLWEFGWDTILFMINLMFIGLGGLLTEAVELAVLEWNHALFYETALIACSVLADELSYVDLIMPLITLLLAIILGLSVLFPSLGPLCIAKTIILSEPCGYVLLAINIVVYIAMLYEDYLD